VTTGDLALLLTMFVGLLTFAALVVERWPRTDPTDDVAYDRRSQAHVRRFPR
jgi:hypothetical protein